MSQDNTFNTKIANAYLSSLQNLDIVHPPVLLIFSAMPGSGKTTLARKLANDLKALYIGHDDIRIMIKELGVEPKDVPMVPISQIIVNIIMADKNNKFIILDGSVDRTWKEFLGHAKELHATPIIIRFSVPLKTLQARLLARDGENSALLTSLVRFKSDFDNCCEHVKADLTLGESYTYDEVLHFIQNKIKS